MSSGANPNRQFATFLVASEPWMRDAACADIPVSRFFPDPGPRIRKQIAAAKAICAGCAVKDACLAHAERTHTQFGIWGGTTEPDRRKIRKQRKQQQGDVAA